jgi:hypothetical protein
VSSAHGKDEVWTIDGDDISYATKTSTWERNPDIHDITGYGKQNKVKRGGLKDGTFTCGGWYDTGATGPRAVLEPLEATTVTLIHKPEGTGTGKPQRSVSVVVGKYSETGPVDDIVQWTCDFAMSDTVTNTTQS